VGKPKGSVQGGFTFDDSEYFSNTVQGGSKNLKKVAIPGNHERPIAYYNAHFTAESPL
jgi:hypothetical protein